MDITKSQSDFEAWFKSEVIVPASSITLSPEGFKNVLRKVYQAGRESIALAAKRAEPVMFRFKYPGERNYTYITHRKPDAFEMEKCEIELLYTTPPLNSPEVPEGWKLVPIEPTQNMVDAHISGMQLAGFSRAYRDMLAAAPEKPL